MSIFVSQPSPSARRRAGYSGLSGLGAYAMMLPDVRRRGARALMEAERYGTQITLEGLGALPIAERALGWWIDTRGQGDVCNAVAGQFVGWVGVLREAWRQAGGTGDFSPLVQAATLYCGAPTVVYQNTYYEQNPAWGWWYEDGQHGHGHHHHDHHPHHGQPVPHAPMARPPMRAPAPMPAPMPASSMTVSRPPMRAAQSLAPAPMQHRGGGHSNRPHRGLGDGTYTLSHASVVGMRAGTGATALAQQATRPGTVQTIQQRVGDGVAAQIVGTAGTLDPCADPVTGNALPCDQLTDAQRAMCPACGGTTPSGSMPSLTIEGALPSGIAAILGGAIGLAVISMITK
jgi:hypothetical protein